MDLVVMLVHTFASHCAVVFHMQRESFVHASKLPACDTSHEFAA